jgi:hypothetical protein
MCRVPARTEDTTTSAVVVVSPVRVLRPEERVRRSGIPGLAPLERHANAGRPGRCATRKRLHRHPRFDLGAQCHAAPEPEEIAHGAPRSWLAGAGAARRWPISLRIPGNHSLCAGARGCALRTTAQSGLAAPTPASVGERRSRAHSRHRTRVSSGVGVSWMWGRRSRVARRRKRESECPWGRSRSGPRARCVSLILPDHANRTV